MSAHSLLEGENELILHYPADETPAQISAKIAVVRGKRVVQLEEASFTPAYPLVYAAVGTIENGVFLPVSTDCRPKLPLSLPVHEIPSPVLQIVDAIGHTAFFELNP